MKTHDMDYGKFFPLDEVGYPEEYPYSERFHEHINLMGDLLRDIKNNPYDTDTIERFFRELKKYRTDGFVFFADKCEKHYKELTGD